MYKLIKMCVCFKLQKQQKIFYNIQINLQNINSFKFYILYVILPNICKLCSGLMIPYNTQSSYDKKS